ncbi:MAG: pirin family protein [Planctomycetota bacterium]|nr:pirin family protein [Planctomycetota bacterium]
MLRIRKSEDRGHFNHGWLDTYHSFSFGEYRDPEHMGFQALRVINEDRVQPGEGFGMHPHHDMEIVTLVLSGSLEHKDSMGNGEVLRPGELQRMSAGTGILHSEFNPSATEPVHLYQIWIKPERKGLEPSYEQKAFDPEGRRNRLQLVAAPRDAMLREGALAIQQDARVYLGSFEKGARAAHELAPGRHAWLQVLKGSVEANGAKLKAGDAAAISDEKALNLTATGDADVLLFDLA